MSNPIHEWVVYHPPKSASFGHHSTPRNPRLAWPTIGKFLNRYTDFTFGLRSELTCCGPGKWTDTGVAAHRITEARRLFGPEKNPTNPDPRWDVRETQLSAAVAFAMDDDRFPAQEMGPVRFHFYYGFLWTKFEQMPYWASEDGQRNPKSHFGITMGGGKLFLQPTFVFPAPWNSLIMKNFLTEIEAALPFQFREQYFRRSLPAAGKGRGRTFKLSKGWRGISDDVHER